MLAWQVIGAEGYTRIDPAHTHGGPDGGGDAMCERDGETWVMAAYFPLGQKTPATIKKKLLQDMKGAKAKGGVGIAFVTNQEITLAEREQWEQLDPDLKVHLFHLLKVTQILNEPQYARTREEFLDIVAGPPPMLIKASILGPAHAFTDDRVVLETFVKMYEQRIRKRSDKGHARVRAEREAKERAERERRERAAAAAAREAAEEAQQERLRELGPKRPWDLAGTPIPRMTDMLGQRPYYNLGQVQGRDSLMDDAKREELLYKTLGINPPTPPQPLDEAQITERVAAYRAGLEARWPACRDYLAGVAWPGLRFRIKNEARSFLNDVQVILTFHGARGVNFEDLEGFRIRQGSGPELAASGGPAVLYRTAGYAPAGPAVGLPNRMAAQRRRGPRSDGHVAAAKAASRVAK
ncbi:hypothetical protein AWC13_02475 [Mycobacterium kubicae]|nr:hypothetical protein AWC13_02475 [Mycobacterium kubicae]